MAFRIKSDTRAFVFTSVHFLNHKKQPVAEGSLHMGVSHGDGFSLLVFSPLHRSVTIMLTDTGSSPTKLSLRLLYFPLAFYLSSLFVLLSCASYSPSGAQVQCQH